MVARVLLLAASCAATPSEIRIGVLVPQVIRYARRAVVDPAGLVWLTAVLLAIEEINNSTQLLPRTRLRFSWRDSARDSVDSMRAAFELSEFACGGSSPVVAFIGPSSSTETSAVANVLQSVSLPLISYFATSPTLGNGDIYQHVFRTAFSDEIQAEAIVDILTNHCK